jgi:hypothetical protein
MAGSVTTTRISLLEIGSDANYDDEGTLFIPSGSTIENSGVIDASGGDILAALSTSTPIDAVVGIADGAFSFTSHSANSIVLAFRSGGTVYEFWNTAGS